MCSIDNTQFNFGPSYILFPPDMSSFSTPKLSSGWNFKFVELPEFSKIVLRFKGCAVAQLVEELRYRQEGRGSDSRWGHWYFSLTWSFRPHYVPGVDSASDRNWYREYSLRDTGGRCVWLTNWSPSWAESLEMWETHPPRTLRACPGVYRDCFVCLLHFKGIYT